MKMFRELLARLSDGHARQHARQLDADVLTNGSFETTLSPWVAGTGINVSSTGNGFAPDGGFIAVIGFNTLARRCAFAILYARSGGLFDYAFKAGRSEGACSCQDVPLTFSVTIDGIELSSALPAYDGSAPSFAAALKLLSTYSGTVALGAGTHEFAFHFSRGETLFGRAPLFRHRWRQPDPAAGQRRARALDLGDDAARLRRHRLRRLSPQVKAGVTRCPSMSAAQRREIIVMTMIISQLRALAVGTLAFLWMTMAPVSAVTLLNTLTDPFIGNGTHGYIFSAAGPQHWRPFNSLGSNKITEIEAFIQPPPPLLSDLILFS